MIIYNAKIVLQDSELENASILIENDRIKKIYPYPHQEGNNIIDATNCIVVPGFIDLHMHGVEGFSVLDNDNQTENISKSLVKYGITGFLLTTMATSIDKMNQIMENVANFENNNTSECYGINIEGSFINPKRAGSHNSEYIFEHDINIMKNLINLSNNKIKIVTIAPELTNESFINYLKENNIIVSIGHSNANFEETNSYIKNGIRYFTHLGNATGMIHQREPGLVTSALLDKNSDIEIICDGIHLHYSIVDLFVRLKTLDKIIIVSDGTCVMGLEPGNYKWYDKIAFYDGFSFKLEDGTIVGGVLPISKSFLNLMKFTSCNLVSAIRTVSLKPARILGIDKEVGSISINKKANLVIFDKDFNIKYTLVNGNIVYSKK